MTENTLGRELLREALWTLSKSPLKDMYSKYFSLGVAINGYNTDTAMINSPELAAITKYHFNSTVYSNLMKAAYLLDQSGCVENAENGLQTEVAVDFSSCIPGLEFAKENGMGMRGHTLVWHTQVPEWFFKTDYKDSGNFVDKETMLSRMESYIKQVLEFTKENYPGVIYAWDVVNEAVETASGQYDNSTGWYTRTHAGSEENLWYKTIGSDYVEKAFEYARKYADLNVKLFYNAYNTFELAKNNAICNLVKMLMEKDLIDGIGMQSHYGLNYPGSLSYGSNSLKTALANFGELGLEIHMTETSITINRESEFEAQANRYKEFFEVLLEMHQINGGPANITNVTFFGIMDRYLLYANNEDYKWLFDAKLQPKPSFYSVQNAVKEFEANNN